MNLYILKAVNVLKGKMQLAGKVATEYAPEILSGTACAGVACVGVSATLDTKAHLEREAERPENRRRTEIVLDTLYDYRRTILVSGLTVASIIASNRVSAKRLAAATAALTAARKEILDLKDAAKEVVGEEKATEIQNVAAEKGMVTGEGPIFRWRIDISEDEFYAPESTVLRAFLHQEHRLQNLNYASLNDFRKDVNLGPMVRSVDYIWDADAETGDLPLNWIGGWWSHEIDERGEYRRIHFHVDPEKVIT